MDTSSPTHDRTGDVPGRRIVELACTAPSVHNTQPWRWRIDGLRIELYADFSRQLEVADPSGRNLVLSCGAALHHARVAAAALGYPAEQVERLPDPADPSHLATLHLTTRPRTPRAVEDLATLGQRSTDRRRFTSWPVPEHRLAQLAASVDVPHVRVVPLVDVASRFRVELLVNRALDAQNADERYAEEHQLWLNRSHADGIPSTAVPELSGHPASQPTRFGLAEPTRSRDLVETSDGLLVICTEEDDTLSWLLAGEALSQMWLAATVDGLSVVPLSQVIELPSTRESLQHEVLGGLTCPQIITRIGWQEIGRSELPRTPRRPVDEVLVP